jgi:hypothetical protein
VSALQLPIRAIVPVLAVTPTVSPALQLHALNVDRAMFQVGLHVLYALITVKFALQPLFVPDVPQVS